MKRQSLLVFENQKKIFQMSSAKLAKRVETVNELFHSKG